jgi:hypothetical protein
MVDKFNRAYGYQQSWFSWYDTQVYCSSDLEDVCTKKEPGYIYVANSDEKQAYLSLAFCERYFKLGTLQDIYNSASKGDDPHNLGSYENRARAWISAIMRVSWISGSDEVTYQVVDYDGVDRYADSSSEVKYLTKYDGSANKGSRPLLSPSNYAWYALAQWVQQKSGDYPQQPYVPDDVRPRQQI